MEVLIFVVIFLVIIIIAYAIFNPFLWEGISQRDRGRPLLCDKEDYDYTSVAPAFLLPGDYIHVTGACVKRGGGPNEGAEEVINVAPGGRGWLVRVRSPHGHERTCEVDIHGRVLYYNYYDE